MGAEGYKSFIDGKRGLDPVAKRSTDYQQAIKDAINGTIDPKKIVSDR